MADPTTIGEQTRLESDNSENDIITTSVKKSIFQKLVEMFKSITLEPAIFVHMLAFKMFYLTLQNIMLEKACRNNLGYSTEICDALTERLVAIKYVL